MQQGKAPDLGAPQGRPRADRATAQDSYTKVILSPPCLHFEHSLMIIRSTLLRSLQCTPVKQMGRSRCDPVLEDSKHGSNATRRVRLESQAHHRVMQ